MNLEQYLEEQFSSEVIDYHLRVWSITDGRVNAYVYPIGRDGTSLQLHVIGESVVIVGQGNERRLTAPPPRPGEQRFTWTFRDGGVCVHTEETFATADDAVADAIRAAARWPGRHPTVVSVGRVKTAREVIGEVTLGGDIAERIDDLLGDAIGEFYKDLVWTDDQRSKLGKLVFDWIERHVGFHQWAIVDVKEHEISVPASNGAGEAITATESPDHE